MTTTRISSGLSDEAVLAELGARLARRRIDLQLTQAALADQAGVAKRTVERIESGASAQMSSVIRLLRVLELLPGLEQLVPTAGPGPMELLRHQGKARQRATARRAEPAPGKPWTWDEDT
jgi:transcriptional regulator with XRE-family HTH domain